MKTLKRTLPIILISLIAFSCYQPLDMNTNNIGKIEIPVKISAPLAKGNLSIELDSMLNTQEFSNGHITHQDDITYFIFDTTLNLYDYITNFIDMDELNFDTISLFDERLLPDFDIDYIEVSHDFGSPWGIIDYNINPIASFENDHNTNAVFIIPSNQDSMQFRVLDVGSPINFNVGFDLYRIDIKSGELVLNIESSDIPDFSNIGAYSYTPTIPDFPIAAPTWEIPIYETTPQLPAGVKIFTTIKASTLKQNGIPLDIKYESNSLDTSFTLALDEYYYEDETGSGVVDVDIEAFLQINNVKDTFIIPLPDTLYAQTSIKDLVFDRVSFDYGKDTIVDDSFTKSFSLLTSSIKNLDIDGFRLSNPIVDFTLISNLGFASSISVDSWFETPKGLELIKDNQKHIANLEFRNPVDPYNPEQYIRIPSDSVSIHLDSATSRVEEIDLLNLETFVVDYMLVVNPEDIASTSGSHNFYYNYPEDIIDDMYDIKLKTCAKIPFEFKFDNINFKSSAAGFNSNATESIDSLIKLEENDSVKICVKLKTVNFPFEAKAQFYFDKFNNNNQLEHIDSLFPTAQTLLPSSINDATDSITWNVIIDNERYKILQQTDSIVFDLNFSMDNNNYFTIKKGVTTEVDYNISIENSSFLFSTDLELHEK